MKTQTRHSQTPPEELDPESEQDEIDELETASTIVPDDEHDSREWRSMESAPKDVPIEGRLSEEQDAGIMMRWRTSRHRVGHTWEIGGVWHDATTPGAVQVRPIAWRPWVSVALHFDTPQEPDAA